MTFYLNLSIPGQFNLGETHLLCIRTGFTMKRTRQSVVLLSLVASYDDFLLRVVFLW